MRVELISRLSAKVLASGEFAVSDDDDFLTGAREFAWRNFAPIDVVVDGFVVASFDAYGVRLMGE